MSLLLNINKIKIFLNKENLFYLLVMFICLKKSQLLIDNMTY
jgi:hypothetical protein